MLSDDQDNFIKHQETIETFTSISIHSLPTEVLLKVFYFLNQEELLAASYVCRTFYEVALDPSLWLDLAIDRIDQSLSDDLKCSYQLLSRRCTRLRSLYFRLPSYFSCLSNFISGQMHMRCLSIPFQENVDKNVIMMIVKNCPQIQLLNLSGCKSIDDDAVQLLSSLPLVSLDLSFCTKLTDAGVSEYLSNSSSLFHLSLEEVYRLTDTTFTILSSCHSKTLVSISLDGDECTDRTCMQLSNCTRLRKLHIGFCEGMTDISLLYLSKLKHLEDLKLKKGTELTKEALTAFLAQGMNSDIQMLDLSECSELNDEGACEIGRRFHLLRSLNLSWCWEISEIGLSVLLAGCQQLTKLILVGVHLITGHCLLTCPCLEFLDLRHCNSIIDSLIPDIVSRRKGLLTLLDYFGEEITYNVCTNEVVMPF